MEKIGESKILSLIDESDELQITNNKSIRQSVGHKVSDFLDLAKKVAALQFHNPEHVLLFRGQNNDHRIKLKKDKQGSYSSLKPPLFRPKTGALGIPNEDRLRRRFEFLAQAEQELIESYCTATNDGDDQKLRRHRILRWAILQHYEVCLTPLLDVTQSLRVASSFASIGNPDEAFIYVLGVPYITGSVTASAEAGLQIIRLSSVCPPIAVRPHIQEGFLLGEYPEMPDITQKQQYASFEIDFSRRLIAKFRFNPTKFWEGNPLFPQIESGALYPDAHDPLFKMAEKLKSRLGPQE